MNGNLTSIDTAFDREWPAIIDVRSPAEFQGDHIPGAINLPALTNSQREEVGTIYVQESRLKARRLGAAHIARNVASYLEVQLVDWPGGYSPLIYCWRGGLRSKAVGIILSQVGFCPILLSGGYKAYRAQLRNELEEKVSNFNVHVVAGLTGTGKTKILNEMGHQGFQTIDLEGLASHRGSVLGRDAENDQPPQKLFESLLWEHVRKFESDRPVWIESESSKIGDVRIPAPLWQKIKEAPQITINVPLRERVAFLMKSYPHYVQNPNLLEEPLVVLKEFHSKSRIAEWNELIASNNISAFVTQLLEYHYDPAYRRSLKKNKRVEKCSYDLPSLRPDAIASLVQKISSDGFY